MKNRRFFIFILFIFSSIDICFSQKKLFHSIDSALLSASEVKFLYINYSFQEIEELPKSIKQLKNLEEFTIFPSIFNNDEKPETIQFLPNAISKCRNLKKLNFTMSSIIKLPKDFGKLDKLEELKLSNSKININNEINKILKLDNLKLLEIIGINISKENLSVLTRNNPQLKIIRTLKDIEEYYKDTKGFDVLIHDNYLVFHNKDDANSFIKSLPIEFSDWKLIRNLKKSN